MFMAKDISHLCPEEKAGVGFLIKTHCEDNLKLEAKHSKPRKYHIPHSPITKLHFKFNECLWQKRFLGQEYNGSMCIK